MTVKQIYNVREAAKLLGISTKTLRRIISADEISWFKVGDRIRLDEDDINNYIQKSRDKCQFTKDQTVRIGDTISNTNLVAIQTRRRKQPSVQPLK